MIAPGITAPPSRPAGPCRSSGTVAPLRRREVRVQTLGGIAVAVDGTAQNAGPADARTRLLLAYLAVRRRAYTNTLCQLFFPEARALAARAQLLRTLSGLTSWLGIAVHRQLDEAVVADARLVSDVPHFEGAVRDGAYGQAVRTYAGAFLAGAPVGISEGLRVWALAWRSRLAELHVRVAYRQAQLETSDAVGVGVAFVDESNRVVAANASYERLSGDGSIHGSVFRTVLTCRTSGAALDAVERDAASVVAARRVPGEDVVMVTVRERRASPDVADLAALGLTPAQRRVARGLARGLPNRVIARRLGVSEHTARRHTEQVFAKLGVRSRAAAAVRLLGSV